jgi:aspartate/methionine/tyrosine aminotransferase
MRYVSITVLGLNIVNRSVIMQVKKTIDADPSIKLIFLCSPGNPTGTLISLTSVRELLDYEPFKGIVVVDEAYIDFSDPGSSAASLVAEYANICVMQTLSKSFGLAAIRCASLHHTFPSLIPYLSTQTRYSDCSTTAHPDSLKHQSTVQYLHSHSSYCTTRFISRIDELYARKDRNAQGITG